MPVSDVMFIAHVQVTMSNMLMVWLLTICREILANSLPQVWGLCHICLMLISSVLFSQMHSASCNDKTIDVLLLMLSVGFCDRILYFYTSFYYLLLLFVFLVLTDFKGTQRSKGLEAYML